MAGESAFPLRVLRRGLKAASRAGASVVERVLRHDTELGPPPTARTPMERRGPAEPGEHTVRFGERVAHVRRGSTLLQAAESAGVELRHYCGGNCSCGTCRVEVVSGAGHLSRAEPMERLVLGGEATTRGDRLACQAEVHGAVTIRVPDWF
jgi:2Fe-2S ferredoxin